jgi:hypothetical protein
MSVPFLNRLLSGVIMLNVNVGDHPSPVATSYRDAC